MAAHIGSSTKFLEVLQDVHAVAATECSVLIQGETGTGKEVIAHAIHASSPRCRGPFVALNCSALPPALFESELFGHEKGAFTGAVNQTVGKILAATGGTLFLDEVGEMPLELQPKLLRVLQERTFERLGSTRSTRADVRIVAATNQDLLSMVQAGLFRADLYYRLSVFPLWLPPLRERREDIPELARHFLAIAAAAQGKHGLTISEELLDILRQHDWPGNIRELQNFIERAVILSIQGTLSPRQSEVLKLQRESSSLSTGTLQGAERQHILRALDESNWVIGGRNGAAAKLGVPRTTLISKMQKLRIGRRLHSNHSNTFRSPDLDSVSGSPSLIQ